jgi:phage FluMu protein Com
MATLNTESLPLHYKYDFPTIEVKPYTYRSLMDYLEGMPNNDSDLYLYDLKWLLRDDRNAEKLMTPDADYLIFLKKAISIKDDLRIVTEVKCPLCGRVNTITITQDDLQFVHPSDQVKYDGVWMELSTGTFLCKLPTVAKMLKVLDLSKTYGLTKHFELVKSMAMVYEQELNPMGVEHAILDAGPSDIPIILKVYDILFSSLLPINKICENPDCELHNSNNGGMSIEVNALIGNLFRSLLLSNPIDGSKIYVRETSEDTSKG